MNGNGRMKSNDSGSQGKNKTTETFFKTGNQGYGFKKFTTNKTAREGKFPKV
jgi:hypothetical protein